MTETERLLQERIQALNSMKSYHIMDVNKYKNYIAILKEKKRLLDDYKKEENKIKKAYPNATEKEIYQSINRSTNGARFFNGIEDPYDMVKEAATRVKEQWADLTKVADKKDKLAKQVQTLMKLAERERKRGTSKQYIAPPSRAEQVLTSGSKTKSGKESATQRNARLALMFINARLEQKPSTLAGFMKENGVTGGQAYNAIKAFIVEKTGMPFGQSKREVEKENKKEVGSLHQWDAKEIKAYVNKFNSSQPDRLAWEMYKMNKSGKWSNTLRIKAFKTQTGEWRMEA